MSSHPATTASTSRYAPIASIPDDTDGHHISQYPPLPHDRPLLPFHLLGAAILLPWNVLLLTFPHFTSLLPPSSSLRSTLPSSLSLLATTVNFLSLAWITFKKPPPPAGRQDSADPSGQIQGSILALIGLQIVMLIGVLGSGGQVAEEGGSVIFVGLATWAIASMVVGSVLQVGVMQLAS